MIDADARKLVKRVKIGGNPYNLNFTPDGRHLLVYNHTARGRSPLNLAVSTDGKEWSAAAILESQPGEYSYPAIIQTADGLIHITYTWKRQRVKHLTVDPAKLVLKPIVDGKWPE